MNQPPNGPGPSLKRVLGLPALILYGIILIQPTAPMPLFGAAAVKAQGHVVTTILIGMAAMLFTAVGYGRMANVYPSAGSAYAYVSREIHPAPGYLVGWGIIFDYVMNPIICVIWCSQAARNILPLPIWVFAVFFTLLFTGMNLRGIEASTRTNAIIAAGLGVVIVLFLGAAVRYLWLHPPGGFAGWSQQFYDPQTFSFRTMSGGAALAVLTYIGFDGISTHSEQQHPPGGCRHPDRAFALTYELGAEMLNFGALIAFMGVNVSSFVRYFLRAERKQVGSLVVPLLGFTVCLYLWLSLGTAAKTAGLVWLALGVLYGGWRTSWFRRPMDFARIAGDEEPAPAATSPEPVNR